jgi:hypothetical protein
MELCLRQGACKAFLLGWGFRRDVALDEEEPRNGIRKRSRTRSYVGGTGGLGYVGALSAQVGLVSFVSHMYEVSFIRWIDYTLPDRGHASTSQYACARLPVYTT